MMGKDLSRQKLDGLKMARAQQQREKETKQPIPRHEQRNKNEAKREVTA